MTQRWVETATVTDKTANTVEKYRERHGFLLNTQKQEVLNFRLGTYVASLREPQFCK